MSINRHGRFTPGFRRQRTAAIRDLVELRVPPEQAETALARFDWDYDEDLFTFRRTDALRLLDRYVQRQMTDEACRRWAEAIEGRGDVGFEAGYEQQLEEFVFSLASPELNGTLSRDAAMRWMDALGRE